VAEPAGPQRGVLPLWFSLEVPVSRRAYWVSGVLLALVKYALDAALIYVTSHKLWSPLAYLSPLYTFRTEVYRDVKWLPFVLAIIALPFLWIGVSMSIRRGGDAGLSPWVGTVFLVPIFNYLLMLALAVLPSRPELHAGKPDLPYRERPARASKFELDSGVKSALFALLAAASLGISMMTLSVHGLGLYGGTLFMVTPFAMGAVSAYFYNRPWRRSFGRTLGVATVSLALAGAVVLLFALEGLMCLLMAAPIALVGSTFGALVGWGLARSPSQQTFQASGVLLVLPLAAGVEAKAAETGFRHQYEVISSVEIAARPEVVWQHVIAFSELDPPTPWEEGSGIAYPVRATLTGSGVGAVRHCEFSTGPFVEPITRWEPGRKLSFDVASQPPPMQEWSPFKNVHPPHLDASLRSRRGEFRLIPLEGGRTRLEGSTWYEPSIEPRAYWRLWTDALIHQIHERVLVHIQRRSEHAR
jgi:hypothetical protein